MAPIEQPELAPAQAHSPTSRQAAEEIEPHRVSLRQRVLDFIVAAGPVTDQEIQTHLLMDPSTERPRRVELFKAGLIRQNGTKKTVAGRDAAAWEAA